MENKEKVYVPKLDIKTDTDKYIIFAKQHLAKEILENLKRLTGDENLSFESELKNNLGEPVKVGDEVKKYIEACGENLIQDLDSLSDKIDEYFFDYKINEPYYIENREELNEKNKDLEDVLKRVEELEKKILTAVETSANISENSKNTFKHILKDMFKEFKNIIDTILNKFKVKDTLNKENTLDKEMKIELLKSNTVTSEMLDRLACDSEISILRKVAKHENTSSETLEKIYNKAKDYKVLENLLNNENTPTKVIDLLAKDDDIDISLIALKHKNISDEILLKASKPENIEVINNILKNENASERVLQNIVGHNINNKEVLKRVLNHASCSENLSEFVNSALERKPSIKDKIKEKQAIIESAKKEKQENKQIIDASIKR